jgi:hypothetical protein
MPIVGTPRKKLDDGDDFFAHFGIHLGTLLLFCPTVTEPVPAIPMCAARENQIDGVLKA